MSLRNKENALTSKLLKAKLNNVKLYWRMISNGGALSKNSNVSCDDFYKYFEGVSNPDNDFYCADNDIVTNDY